jgi:hypothetical protein
LGPERDHICDRKCGRECGCREKVGGHEKTLSGGASLVKLLVKACADFSILTSLPSLIAFLFFAWQKEALSLLGSRGVLEEVGANFKNQRSILLFYD